MTGRARPPGGGDPDDASGAGAPRRTGLDLARSALAAAKAEAKRRGSTGRTGRSVGGGPTAQPQTGVAGRRASVDQRSGAHPDDRDPQLLASSLERLLAERGWQTDAAVGSVMGRWRHIVGADLAAHSEPIAFDAGELLVQAESTAWATQLRLLTAPLRARLDEELGPGTVTSIKVVGPQPPSWKRGRLSVRGRGARDTYG